MVKNYSWQRYWYKSDDPPLVVAGFLYIHEYTKNAFTLDSLSDVPCLVLRGEPGMGKSKEIRRIYEGQTITENADKIYFDLSSYGDESRLVKEIFESDQINQWKNNNNDFHLFLDSLDEALLDINTLALLLADEIAKLPTRRLFLRIACRTAEWSTLWVLEHKLKEIWKEDRCQILQIAPLQQNDVEIAAQTENLNAEKFLTAIFEKNVSALASKPITLQFLLNLFEKNSSFPSTQTELYALGCLTLCEEKNERRRAAKRIGKLTTEQRFVIAARIAALMMFGNKSSIWIGGITEKEDDSDILINELSGFAEKEKNGNEFAITEESIQEVIFETGLFTSSGNKRIKYSHQTFAEFLASLYLEHKELPDETIIKIIGEEYLYPQLYETAAWIASRRSTVFRHLMKVAPLILLRSDVLSAEENLRAQLTERLLEIFENEDARDWDSKGYYQKLKHSQLGEQLRPFIANKEKGWLVRRVAIDIAEACEVKELQDDLLKVVLDKSEEHHTRINAAYAVKRIGSEETKAKLKPLIYGDWSEDEHLELKGVAISALWREQLPTQELLDVFVEPPHSFLGSYKAFFYEFGRNLTQDDIPIVLAWLRKKIVESGDLSYDMQGLLDDVMAIAWQNIENKEIFDAYVKIVLPFLKIHRQGLMNSRDEYTFDQQTLEKRRRVLIHLLPLVDDKHDWLYLGSSPLFRLRLDDTGWLIEEWDKTDNLLLKEKIMLILKDFVGSTQHYYSNGADPDFLEKICRAMDSNQEFNDEIYPLLEAIKLNSELAGESRKRYEEILSWHKREKGDEELLTPSPKERVINCLDKFEKGEIAWWWQMTIREMTLLSSSKNYGNQFDPNISNLPGWKDASEETKRRIINAAREYLINGEPDNDSWIETHSFPFPALGGLQAIRLLEIYDDEFLEQLEKEVWERWLPIVYLYPMWGLDAEESHKWRRLIAKLYRSAPNRILELLSIEIRKESKRKENPHISFGKLEFCWNEKLKKVLKDSLADNKLSDSLFNQILTQLFELGDEDAERLACDLIKKSMPKRDRAQRRMILAATLLIQYGKTNCWEKIWKVFTENIDFAKQIVEAGVYRFGRQGIGNLPEEQTAELYIWLSKQYPHKEDPDFSGEGMAHAVGPREETGSWRNSLLDHLKHKGTPESVLAIEKIKRELPHLDWLKFTFLDAQENMRLKTWQPFSTSELLKMFSTESKSLDLSFEKIENKLDLISSNLEKSQESQEKIIKELTDELQEFIDSNLDKLSAEDRKDYDSIKNEDDYDLKIKFVVPFIEKLGIKIETKETKVKVNEILPKLRKVIFGENLQVNLLENNQNSDNNQKLLTDKN